MQDSTELLAEMNRKMKRLPSLFSRYGRRFNNQRLPKGYRRMRAQDCYFNAFRLISRDPENLTYCEGLLSPATIETHAWVVDREGNVIDTTWQFDATREYLGIPFRSDYVFKTVGAIGLHESLVWFGLAELTPSELSSAVASGVGADRHGRRMKK